MKEVIYIRIDRDIKQQLDEIALEEDRSLNNLVIRILKEYLEKQKKTK
jgi:predicted HicB family RNase H-like nuclease